jgi:predicted acyltransferase
MQQRNQCLDALRGFAILAMVLSSSIAFGILPAWMYHAQVPPPYHVFKPDLPGITWVDLVFPFFLFSMGAAIPLALNKKIKEEAGSWSVVYIAGRRFLLLVFFALFTFHMRAWVQAEKPTAIHYWLSVVSFVLLFFQFFESKGKYKLAFQIARAIAFALAALLLYILPFKDGKGFSFMKEDIIIIVLGNMAFFSTLIWWFTKNKPWLRIGILGFVMAVFLGSKTAGSWNEAVFNFTPAPWMYKFYYLKYLFIVLPGTLAGDWLLESSKAAPVAVSQDKKMIRLITFLSILLITLNVCFLFSRQLLLNLGVSVTLLSIIYYCMQKLDATGYKLLQRFFTAGCFMLLLGLSFDAFEGGVKKDPSTYSYYFITSGLAFFALLGFYGMQNEKLFGSIINFFSLNGRNPMVAYVTGNLLLIPVLHLTGLFSYYTGIGTGPWTGFLEGLFFTGVVSLITIFFTKRQWFWKT